ncbi:uncharacterized protein LOC132195254 [Neocloeon triangulifer]|uniref:uncharacterized protein LOC132195254 n=1 Tax=Neocloeon triangulifer TaxID=2078957 RepID=UPI00286F3076|nr:uncharacterized protein LOC132195254 [Neocloeon triangulifer]XP_059473106.1 uncharacterized protein LOC132195254 [Neocloeon triangulifer]
MLVQEKVVLLAWTALVVTIMLLTYVFKKPLFRKIAFDESSITMDMISYHKDFTNVPQYLNVQDKFHTKISQLEPEMRKSMGKCASKTPNNQIGINQTYLMLRKNYQGAEDLQIFLSAACSYLTMEATNSSVVQRMIRNQCYSIEGQQYFLLLADVTQSTQISSEMCGNCTEDYCLMTDENRESVITPREAMRESCRSQLGKHRFLAYLPNVFDSSPTLFSFCKKLHKFEEMSYYYQGQDKFYDDYIEFMDRYILMYNMFYLPIVGSSLFSLLLLSNLYRAPFKVPGNQCLIFHALSNLILKLGTAITFFIPWSKLAENRILDIALVRLPFFCSMAAIIWITL